MSIALLRINNFRNIESLEIKPTLAGLNLIVGQNGSGKSSLLESIYFFAHGKSFRAGNAATLINHKQAAFLLFAQLKSHQYDVPIAVEKNQTGSLRLRKSLDDAKSIYELASLLPLRLINSQSHQIFESGPQFRRKYLDWGLFYQYEDFYLLWRHFERALKQRNILLSQRRYHGDEFEVWTQQLMNYGNKLHHLRQDYLKDLAKEINALAPQLLVLDKLEISYNPGWPADETFESILSKSQEEDWRFGYTQYGPQRADLMVKTNDVNAKHFLSRGQQKLLICAMILAQGSTLTKIANKRLIYLVDDLPSELDFESRKRLLSLLINQPSQVFITAIESHTICDAVSSLEDVPMMMFHVEQGRVVNTIRREM